MPKIILEFDAETEREDALQAQYGGDYASAIEGFKEDLRRKYKHVSSEIIDEVWVMIDDNFNGLVGL